MSYGLHIAKDDGSGYFSYTGLVLQAKYGVTVFRPDVGTFTLNIPPAPTGFTYVIGSVTGIYQASLGNIEGPYKPSESKFKIYNFPQSSYFGTFVKSISVTDSGVVTYVGDFGGTDGLTLLQPATSFIVYIRGIK